MKEELRIRKTKQTEVKNKNAARRKRSQATHEGMGLQIVRMFSGLPKTTEAQVLGKQVLRSGTSVGANYREAYRARSRAEFIAKCGDSLREFEETAYWLELLVDGKIVPSDKVSLVRHEWSDWDERHAR
jgi:four helix bundle protein